MPLGRRLRAGGISSAIIRCKRPARHASASPGACRGQRRRSRICKAGEWGAVVKLTSCVPDEEVDTGARMKGGGAASEHGSALEKKGQIQIGSEFER